MADDANPLSLTLQGALPAAGVGFLVGALEALLLPLAVPLHLSLVQVGLLGVLAVLSMGVLGGLVGLVVGLPVHIALRRIVISRGLAVQVGLVFMVLLAVFFAPLMLREIHDGRAWVAFGFIGFNLIMPVIAFLFASRLFRLGELGQKSPPFLPIAGGVALLGVLGGVGLSAGRDIGGAGALQSDPRMVVILVDGLRHDLGGPAPEHLASLARTGTVFTNAVTPQPDTAAAVATVLSGRTPLLHEVVDADDRLGRYGALLQNVLREAGYATAGFVSHGDLAAARGFGYRFHVFDDERGAPLAGLTHLRAFAPLALLAPEVRDGASTVDRFLSWFATVRNDPFFAVVHLADARVPFEPRGLSGFEANGTPGAPVLDHRARVGDAAFSETEQRTLRRLYREEVAYVDGQIGRILRAIDDAGLADNTVVVVAGTGGTLLGEQAGRFGCDGLYDPTLRTHMVLRVPGTPAGQTVNAQVRLHDLYPTLLDHAEIVPDEPPESISLLGYLEGTRSLSLWTPILGRDLRGDGRSATGTTRSIRCERCHGRGARLRSRGGPSGVLGRGRGSGEHPRGGAAAHGAGCLEAGQLARRGASRGARERTGRVPAYSGMSAVGGVSRTGGGRRVGGSAWGTPGGGEACMASSRARAAP